MKVPQRDFIATVRFYESVVGLPICERGNDSVCFNFGTCRLWVDSREDLSQPETWLELRTSDIASAEKLLETHGVARCDEVERLPDDLPAFWIRNPAGVVHLVTERT